MKEVKQAKEDYVMALNEKMKQLKEEQQAKRAAQRERRIEHETAEDMNEEYLKVCKELKKKESEVSAMKTGGEGFIDMASYAFQVEQLHKTMDQLYKSTAEGNSLRHLYNQEKRSSEKKEREINRLKK